MQKIRLSLFLLLFIWINNADAQYNHTMENSVWAFGKNSGMDFSGGAAVPFHSNLVSDNGCASVADANGRLLFYSNGYECWDRNHNRMPNGDSLLGNGTWSIPALGGSPYNGHTWQGVCIVPVIGKSRQYYLFSLENNDVDGPVVGGYSYATMGKLYYSVVDMNLNNGLGDIVTGQKNIYLGDDFTDAMIAIAGNNCDVWLVLHKRSSDIFTTYNINDKGINTTPVISAVGAGMTKFAMRSSMVVSPNRKMLALSSGVIMGGGVNNNELFKFDATTGVLSDSIALSSGFNFAGFDVCFSPDNAKLYLISVVRPSATIRLYQFDVSNYNGTAIRASRLIVSNATGYKMKLFKDKIYLASFAASAIGTIDFPNLVSPACQLSILSIPIFAGTATTSSLPNEVVFPVFDSIPVSDKIKLSLCEKDSLVLSLPPVYTSCTWDDGSTDTTRVIKQIGTYWRRSQSSCGVHVDTFVVTDADTVIAPQIIKKLCSDQGLLQLQATGGYNTYKWNDGSTDSIRMVREGSYWVVGQKGCAVKIDSFIVSKIDIEFSLGPDTSVCSPGILLKIPMPGGNHQWQDGSTNDEYNVTQSGIYWVKVIKEECIKSDTVHVTIHPVPHVAVTSDKTLYCYGDTVHLQASGGTYYNWKPISIMNLGNTAMLYLKSSGAPYTLIGYNEYGCIDSVSGYIDPERGDCKLFLPDAFTPNGDGKNDYFRPILIGGFVKVNQFSIYDRWGKQVWSGSNSIALGGWDGTYNGVPADLGVYFYLMESESVEGKKIIQKGDVTLIK